MDPELITYLDTHFSRTSQQISEVQQQVAAVGEETLKRFKQVDRRFEEFDRRFDEVNSRFQEVNARFDEVNARFDEVNSRFEEVNFRFEQVETTCRQTLVLLEGLRHEFYVVAEGYLGVNERLQVQVEKSEVLSSQVQGWIEPYYKELDIRVKAVESRVDRQNMQVFQAVHKVLGKPLPE